MLRIKDTVYTLASQRKLPICTYIYDLAELKHCAEAMVSCLPSNCELFYAAKANPDKEIVQALMGIVDGFEAASGGELSHLHQHISNHPLIFGGPGKLDDEINQAIQMGVELIHVESINEIIRLQNVAESLNTKQDILLRMNICIDNLELTKLAMGGKPTPFGIDESQLDDAIALILNCKNINFRGFHFHLMSHQLDEKNHLGLMLLYFRKFKQWRDKYQLDIEQLNVGGGIGIHYEQPGQRFNWTYFCRQLDNLINTEKMDPYTIRFECGRYIAADCGYYAVEVLDIKNNFNENFVICRGGTHQFRTPAAQNHNHPFTVLRGVDRINSTEIKSTTATLVGQLCTPKDVMAKQQDISTIAVGDYVLFSSAGAYAWNISHQNFLMHPAPDFIYLN